MEKCRKQTLLDVANLKLPSFQVVVVNANLGCTHCRHRISQIISRITGLKEYTIDVGRKQVIVKGDVRNHHDQKKDGAVKSSHMNINENHSRIFAFFFTLRWITNKMIAD